MHCRGDAIRPIVRGYLTVATQYRLCAPVLAVVILSALPKRIRASHYFDMISLFFIKISSNYCLFFHDV